RRKGSAGIFEMSSRFSILENLRVRNFRNLERVDLGPCESFNVFFGENGAGKTNLLEAIYYLGALKSFRVGRTEDLIAASKEYASIEGRLAPGSRVFRVLLPLQGRRQAEIDGKRPRSVGTWYGSLPVVLFHPRHTDLASGPPETRRAFLDRVLEQ